MSKILNKLVFFIFIGIFIIGFYICIKHIYNSLKYWDNIEKGTITKVEYISSNTDDNVYTYFEYEIKTSDRKYISKSSSNDKSYSINDNVIVQQKSNSFAKILKVNNRKVGSKIGVTEIFSIIIIIIITFLLILVYKSR